MTAYLDATLPRCVQPFDLDWQFALTDSLETPANETAWRAVQLPHDWSIETEIDKNALSGGAGGFFRGGIGWYRKRFTVCAKAWERVELLFDGVWKHCDVWMNGEHILSHENGYVSFLADVTRALNEGGNECLVRVANDDMPNSRWYTGSGITRMVRIRGTHRLCFAENGLFITTPDAAHAAITVETTESADGASVLIEARDAAGRTLATATLPLSDGKATAMLPLDNPPLWSVDAPNLCVLHATLRQGEQTLDELELSFGVRTFRFDEMEGFFLNDKPLKLNGVCLHHDGGCVGAAVPKAVWQRRFAKLKAMGCNAIRVSHNPPDREFLELCDEMGFVVNAELFDEWREVKRKTYNNYATQQSHGYGEVFDRCAREDALQSVRRDRNHPSIVLWSVGNEIPEQVRAEGVELVKRLRQLVLSVDATRPVTTANDLMHAEPSATLEEFMSATDVVGANYIDRWTTYAERMFEPDKLAHPDWIFYGSEHSAIYGWRGDYCNAGESTSWFSAPYATRMLKAERLMKFTQTRPYVCGDFMWTGIDHLGENDWPMKSSISGVLDTAGFEKDGYYFYQSIWVKDRPALHLFPWLNLGLEEGKITPFVVYTNCAQVELWVNGKSYGKKAYEFPARGMRGEWDGYDQPLLEITTNDLHLTWDVPYQEGVVEAVGYDYHGNEIARTRVCTSDAPAKLEPVADRETLCADGRDVVQVELTLQDAQGHPVMQHDVDVSVSVRGPLTLLGMDNGRGDCHVPFAATARATACGKLYAIARSTGEAGEAELLFTAQGVQPASVRIRCIGAESRGAIERP